MGTPWRCSEAPHTWNRVAHFPSATSATITELHPQAESGTVSSGVLEDPVFLDTSRTRPLPAWCSAAARGARPSNLAPGPDFRGSRPSLGMAPQAWMVGENGEDLHGTRELLPLSKLQEIGVLYWHLDPKKSESEEELAEIRKERGYSYMDLIEICPGKLENYEEKVRNFFREHMHADEEIRYCLEGSGYFDVRDKDDKWVRIWIKEGDMIVLPAGIYHRFTVDDANYVKLMRLFIGEPVWTAYNRPQEDHPVRQEYVKSLSGNAGFALAAY